jgi:hypothetical protein
MIEEFAVRVARLRREWQGHGQLRLIRHMPLGQQSHELLLLLHQWAADAVEVVHSIYGETIAITETPVYWQEMTGSGTFSVGIGSSWFLEFTARPASPPHHWRDAVTASLILPDRVRSPAQRRPGRNSDWTREQVEDLILQLLTVMERERSGHGGNGAGKPGTA